MIRSMAHDSDAPANGGHGLIEFMKFAAMSYAFNLMH